jgi:hypothetical protein
VAKKRLLLLLQRLLLLLHPPLLLLLTLLPLHPPLLLLLTLLLLHQPLPTRSNPSVSCKSHPCGGFFLGLVSKESGPCERFFCWAWLYF